MLRQAVVIFLTLVSLASCTQHETADPTATARNESETFRVGLLTPGSVNDGGWNATAYEGLQRISAELGAEVSHQETKTPAEFEDGFRSYGAKRFDLVFGHGFEFQDAAKKVGSTHPDTVFITTSGTTVAPNVAPMVFELEQATYVLGVVAALESKGRCAGLVGGIRLPSIESTFNAFRAGAQSVDPKFQVREVYTGNFDDAGAARLATLSVVNAGCDFVFHQTNEAGRGVFQACGERNIRCFGSNRNQNDLAPDVILASAVLDVPKAFVEMARAVREKRFEPRIQYFGMKDGIISVAWNEKLRQQLAPATIAAATRVEQEIRAGSLKVPRGF